MGAELSTRRIVPEVLDGLPADDTRAIHSRRDLAKINALMFQARIMAFILRDWISSPPARILELGSGDGRFMLAVARLIGGRWRNVELVMVDQADLVTERTLSAFEESGWLARPAVDDVFAFLQRPGIEGFDLVCANLFLHHFDDRALADLLAHVKAVAPSLVATEPRRNAIALHTCSLLRLVGANDVTLHDASASVRAGFSGFELQSLWPASGSTRFREGAMGPFTHIFAAETDG